MGRPDAAATGFLISPLGKEGGDTMELVGTVLSRNPNVDG